MGTRRGSRQAIGFTYSFDVHMGIARGPLDQIAAIRAGDREFWNGSATALTPDGSAPANIDQFVAQGNLFGGPEREGGIVGSLKVYYGASDQVVDAGIKSQMGGLVSNWRGVTTAYYSGQIATNNPYPKPWSFRVRRALSGWDGTPWYPQKARIWLTGSGGASDYHNSIMGMNGAHILYECITNRVWGRGAPRAMINEESFVDAANRLCDEGFGLCMVWDRKGDLDEFVGEVVNHIGGALYIDRFTGLWTLRLIRDNYDPNELAVFDYSSGLLGIEEDESGTREGAINEIVVEYFDVVRKSKASVREQDPAGFATRGAIRSVTASYPGIPTAALAARVAARDLRAQSLNLRRFKLKCDRRAWNVAPASVLKISVPTRGITSMIVRVARVTDSVITDGTITLDVVQDVFGLPATSFSAVQISAWEPPPNVVPAPALRLYEANWMDLSATLPAADLAQIEEDDSIVIGYSVTPGALAIEFDYETSPDDTTWTKATTSAFAPRVTFTAPLDYDTTDATLAGTPPPTANDVAVGEYGRITEDGVDGEEIVSVVSYNPDTGAITLKRGCGDTPPREWSADAELIFFLDAFATDRVEYASGETLYARALARSYSAVSEPGGSVSITAANRLGRPYAPGDVRVDGQPFWNPITAPSWPIEITWAHRNRLTQADVAVGHGEPSTTPEVGTTYTLRIFDNASDTLIKTISGISGETVSYDPATDGDTLPPVARFELRAVRGGVESFLPVPFVVSTGITDGFDLSFDLSFDGS